MAPGPRRPRTSGSEENPRKLHMYGRDRTWISVGIVLLRIPDMYQSGPALNACVDLVGRSKPCGSQVHVVSCAHIFGWWSVFWLLPWRDVGQSCLALFHCVHGLR